MLQIDLTQITNTTVADPGLQGKGGGSTLNILPKGSISLPQSCGPHLGFRFHPKIREGPGPLPWICQSIMQSRWNSTVRQQHLNHNLVVMTSVMISGPNIWMTLVHFLTSKSLFFMSLWSVIAKFHLKLGVTLCSITTVSWCTRMLTYINFCIIIGQIWKYVFLPPKTH